MEKDSEAGRALQAAGVTPASLNAAINAELKSPEMLERLLRLGAEIRVGTPEDFGAFIAQEGPKWAEVIKSSGLKLE